MRCEKPLQMIRQVFTSSGFFYAVIIVLAVCVVDFKLLDTRIKMRRLNDARPDNLFQLVLLSKGEIPSARIDWPVFLKYFELVVRYMPHEEVSRMFLGAAEYYTGDPHKTAFGEILRSADEDPFIFWNIYDTAVLAFERGDMLLSIRYLERALVLPPERVIQKIHASVLYRQILSATDVDMGQDIQQAKHNVLVLRAAAYYYAKDHEKARDAALFALDKVSAQDLEPLYFYAGAASLSLKQLPQALSFFSECIRLRSKNPLVYRFSGEILKAMGKVDESAELFKIAGSLHSGQDSGFPYGQRLGLKFF